MENTGYSKRQIEEMHFPKSDYFFPTEENTVTAKLVMKEWGQKANLICYFDVKDGSKIKLCVWFNSDDNKTYRPKKASINFKEVKLNTDWIVSFTLSKQGLTNWINAIPLNKDYN